jgi:hypothetical protein
MLTMTRLKSKYCKKQHQSSKKVLKQKQKQKTKTKTKNKNKNKKQKQKTKTKQNFFIIFY